MSNIRFVEYAKAKCIVDASSLTSSGLTCTLNQNPTCGQNVPYIYSTQGLVNNTASLTPVTTQCTAVSVWPTTDLNLLGEDNITISGSNFPYEIELSTVNVSFNDANNTPCKPQWSNSSHLVCLTSGFYQPNGQSIGLTININGLAVSNSLSFSTMSDTKSGMALIPSTASPVLKSKVNITLDPTFPYVLEKSDFSVNATNISNPEYFRQMNVIAVDDANKVISVMFGGAYSGDYRISVRHRVFGLLDTTGLTFIVGANVTSISPTSGSIYGGTLVTITGSNFGNVITDNPVQISTLGGVGSTNCYVQTTNNDTITCRVDTSRVQTPQVTGKLVTFLKTSEEAKCEATGNCDFTYVTPEANVNSAQLQYANNEWFVVISGTGFTGDTSSVELVLDGKRQSTRTVTSTQVWIAISDA
jgi:hypothetical protein